MQIINQKQLKLNFNGDESAEAEIIEQFVRSSSAQLATLQGILSSEGTSLKGAAALHELLTSATRVGAERVAVVGRRVSIAFEEGNAARAAILLNQLQWELDAVMEFTAKADELRLAS